MREKQDPYLRHASEIKPPIGMTSHDFARVSPGPSLTRTFELVSDSEEKDFPKSPEYILAKGAAVGLDESGKCCHFALGMRFVGFLQGQNATRASVKSRGSVVLKIEGLTKDHQGKPIFCTGPNEFSLDSTRGAAEIGKIRLVELDKAAIAFRRFNDQRPLTLDVRPAC